MMNLETRLEATGRLLTKVRVAAIGLIAVAYVFADSDSGAFAQTPPPSPPIGDLAAIAKCLAGEGCTRPKPGTESAPPAACAADTTVKAMPELLRARIRAFEQSNAAARCDAAQSVMAPLGEKIRDAYERDSTGTLTPEQAAATHNYIDACMTPDLLNSAGPLTQSEEAHLRRVSGLIVERDPRWGGPRQICSAVAMGRLVITAKSCLPPDVNTQSAKGAYFESIAFQFLNSPTLYGLALRQFGSNLEPSIDPELDYAFLEIVAAPGMLPVQNSSPRFAPMRLNEDLFALTTNIFLRLAAGLGSSTKLDPSKATRTQHNILCRPAHIAPNGLFLHGCQLLSIVTRGAPLFQRQDGELVFVGIHSGATKSLANRSLASCAPGLPSYGIAIPPALIARTLLK